MKTHDHRDWREQNKEIRSNAQGAVGDVKVTQVDALPFGLWIEVLQPEVLIRSALKASHEADRDQPADDKKCQDIEHFEELRRGENAPEKQEQTALGSRDDKAIGEFTNSKKLMVTSNALVQVLFLGKSGGPVDEPWSRQRDRRLGPRGAVQCLFGSLKSRQ